MAIIRTTTFFPPVPVSVATAPVRSFTRAPAHARVAARLRALLAMPPSWRFVVGFWAVGFAATILAVWAPSEVIRFHNPALHPALDSVQACIALAVAGVVYGRFRRRRMFADLVFAQGLVLVAVGRLTVAYVAEKPGSEFSAERFDAWLGVTLRVVGILVIAAAALLGNRVFTRRVSPFALVAVPVTVIVVIVAAVWLFSAQLPGGPADPTGDGLAQQVVGNPLLDVAHAVGAAGLAVASIAFASQSARRGNELGRWLAAACGLGAFAQVNHLLTPTLFTDWFHLGNLLGAAASVVLLLGAIGEFKRASDANVDDAVRSDRLRLAREIHDGVIQELSYIRSESQTIGANPHARGHIVGACDRALDEARSAVQSLSTARNEPLSSSLFRASAELATRHRFDLVADLDDSITLNDEQRHALTRIVREAIGNAIRHASAETITVRLCQSDGRRCLTIEDDGHGFDLESANANSAGFGLISMRERARALPGSFDIFSEPGRGSKVTVQW